MFAGIYHAAWIKGIPASALDRSPAYVVAWMIQNPEEAGETPESLIDLAVERQARRGG